MAARFYQLPDGKIWSVEKASYISSVPQHPENNLITLCCADGSASEDYLIRTLRFYGYPLGELAEKCPEAIREQLAELDEKYLTPRILAGLATGDAYAAEQWAAHEREAAPLRQKLAELEQA